MSTLYQISSTSIEQDEKDFQNIFQIYAKFMLKDHCLSIRKFKRDGLIGRHKFPEESRARSLSSICRLKSKSINYLPTRAFCCLCQFCLLMCIKISLNISAKQQNIRQKFSCIVLEWENIYKKSFFKN